MSKIHVANAAGEQSEYDEAELKALWDQGVLKGDDLYWIEGMAEWEPLSSYFVAAAPSGAAMPAPEPTVPPPATLSPAAAAPRLVASGAPPADPVYTYTKDPRRLTAYVVVMLWISLGFEIVTLLSDAAQMSLMGREYTEEEAMVNDARQQIIAIGYLITYLVTGVGFLRWIHRANANSHGFGARHMEFTPGWSVGFYFIPIMNLFRPYQSMKEIWQVSLDPKNWQRETSGSLVGGWWALWIASSILGQVVFRTSMSAETIEQIRSSTGYSMLASAVGVVLCLVAMKMVKTIARQQDELVSPR